MKEWIYLKSKISKLIRNSTRDFPIKSTAIKSKTGATKSELITIVRDLRRSGNPIASNTHGYFWARFASELETTLHSFEGRLAKTKQQLDAILVSYNHMKTKEKR